MDFKRIIKEEVDKMSLINLEKYYKDNSDKKEWLQILSKFPKELQREIIDERPNPIEDDIKMISSWSLNNDKPIKVDMKKLLSNKLNLDSVGRTPQDVIDHINKKWGLNVKSIGLYDQNPDRYFKYAKLPQSTAKPSVMVDGEVIWGVGRFIASLIRGDKYMYVWSLSDR
jgi:hypothetical protein